MASSPTTTGARQVAPSERRPGRFVFLDLLRAIAVLVVVYSHLVGIFLHQHHDTSTLASAVQGFAAHPLELALQLGRFGVVLFFLVSGFVVTHTGFAENPRQYATKRFLRIYPMLVVSVLLAAVLFGVGLHPVTTGQLATVTPLTLLTNMTLLNHLLAPLVLLVDVSWTLIIELLFYAMLLVALPLMRRAVWPVIVGEEALVAVVMATAHLGGSSYFLFAQNLSYVPALLLGQCVWAVWSRRLPWWAGVGFGALAAGEYWWAGVPGFGRDDHSLDLNLAIGFVIFVVALLAENRMRQVRLVRFLADRSYSLYLLHGLVGYAVLNVVYPVAGFSLALLAGVVATFLFVEAGFRFVERPGMRLARRLARRWGPVGRG